MMMKKAKYKYEALKLASYEALKRAAYKAVERAEKAMERTEHKANPPDHSI